MELGNNEISIAKNEVNLQNEESNLIRDLIREINQIIENSKSYSDEKLCDDEQLCDNQQLRDNDQVCNSDEILDVNNEQILVIDRFEEDFAVCENRITR